MKEETTTSTSIPEHRHEWKILRTLGRRTVTINGHTCGGSISSFGSFTCHCDIRTKEVEDIVEYCDCGKCRDRSLEVNI